MLTSTPRVFGTVKPTSDYPTPYGLFSVVQTPNSTDPHWINGVAWEHSACLPVSGISGICDDEESEIGLPIVYPYSQNVQQEASPFTLYGSHVCSPVGADGDAAAVFENLAKDNLLRHQQEGVERAIWTGNLNNEPYLATTDTIDLTPTPGTATTFKYALGLLVDHAADIYGTGGSVVHAPREIAIFMSDFVEDVSGHKQLKTGELVSLGGGYPNTGPDGTPAAAGTAWLYITPPVMMLASEITTLAPNPLSMLDRLTNDFYAQAFRTFVVGWDDCPLAAILVDLDT